MSNDIFPVIDVSDLVDDGSGSKADEIVAACKTWGFLILTGHGIPQAEVDSMYELNQGFCKLPQDEKLRCAIDEQQIGYDLKHSANGAHESMVFGGLRGAIERSKNLHTYWDASRRHSVEAFKARCHTLALRLLSIFARHFGLPPTYFTAAHSDKSDPPNVLRMLHYPQFAADVGEGIPRLRTHTDWGSLTFVWPKSGGLEVESPTGCWAEVPLVPESVVVNIGDALHLWSGRALKSTLHRISFENLPIDQSRWSMAYFVNANKDARLEVLQRRADGTYAPQPGGIVLTAGEYYDARNYGSRRHDAKNNWVSKSANLDYYEGVLAKVQKVGVMDYSVTA